MIQERVRLGQTLILPRKWRETIRAADGDELTALYYEDGILIVKDPDSVEQSLQAFAESSTSSYERALAHIHELAAEYETSPLMQLASQYTGPGEMSPELEALYLEAEQETLQSHLPPLQEGTIIELPEEFLEYLKSKGYDG
jgi:bifunctional DNA-binding transcriptional regulator/antitoxin component of YhaV-PrlF toxin-antitoxin module